MSSALQCLFHTKELVEYFFSKNYSNDLYNKNYSEIQIKNSENLTCNKTNEEKNTSDKNIDNLNIETNTFSFIIDVEYKDSSTIKLNESTDNSKNKELFEIKNEKLNIKNSEFLEKNNFNNENKKTTSNTKVDTFVIKIDENEEDKLTGINEEPNLNLNNNEMIKKSKSILEFSQKSYCNY